MTLNPYLGMDREQLDYCRVLLQLAAALGSFEAAFESLDRCNGDEKVDLKLWELSAKELEKLADLAGMIQASGGGKEVEQALCGHPALVDCTRELNCSRDSTPHAHYQDGDSSVD